MTYQPSQYPLAYPQQGMPQGYPPQGVQNPYGQMPPQGMPTYGQPQYGQQQQMPPPPLPQPPTVGAPQQAIGFDEQAALAALQESEARAATRGGSGGPLSNYVKVLGPRGQIKWGPDVPVGFTGEVLVWLCGPYAPGMQLPWVETCTHFVKTMSRPKGVVIPCSDDDKCLFCQSRELALSSHDPRQNQAAQMWGRKRRQYLYNAINLSDARANWYKDNQMRPCVLGASSLLQKALATIMNTRGIKAVVDYANGHPIKLLKKKTGPEDINVEWSAIDLNAQPLDQYFWAATYQLWDLAKENDPTPPDQILRVVQELGMPVPPGAAQFQVPAGYQPTAQPPYASPYPSQPPQYPPQAAAGAMGSYLPPGPPMAPPMTQAPPQYQQAPAYTPPVGSLPPPPPVHSAPAAMAGQMLPPPPPPTAPGGSQMAPPPMGQSGPFQAPPPPPPGQGGQGFNPPPPPPPPAGRPY